MYTLELLPPIFAVTCRYVRPINRKHEAVETTIRIGDLLLEDLAQKVVGISSEYIGFQPVDENGNPLTFQGRRVALTGTSQPYGLIWTDNVNSYFPIQAKSMKLCAEDLLEKRDNQAMSGKENMPFMRKTGLFLRPHIKQV